MSSNAFMDAFVANRISFQSTFQFFLIVVSLKFFLFSLDLAVLPPLQFANLQNYFCGIASDAKLCVASVLGNVSHKNKYHSIEKML